MFTLVTSRQCLVTSCQVQSRLVMSRPVASCRVGRVVSCQVRSGLVNVRSRWSGPVLSGHVSGRVASRPVRSGLVMLVVTRLFGSCLVRSGLVLSRWSCHVRSCRVASRPVVSGPVASSPVPSGQVDAWIAVGAGRRLTRPSSSLIAVSARSSSSSSSSAAAISRTRSKIACKRMVSSSSELRAASRSL
jgi:hypothetical protein